MAAVTTFSCNIPLLNNLQKKLLKFLTIVVSAKFRLKLFFCGTNDVLLIWLSLVSTVKNVFFKIQQIL